MGTVLLALVVVLVVAALIFGVVSLLSGDDPGLVSAEPDGRAAPLPNNRSLTEDDIKSVRFDVTWRGYRMSQIDRVLRRTAYDIGYKNEMIAVLEAEVAALREGRAEDADLLRKARESAASTATAAPETTATEAEPTRHRETEILVADAGPVGSDGESADPATAAEAAAGAAATAAADPRPALRPDYARAVTEPAESQPAEPAEGEPAESDTPSARA